MFLAEISRTDTLLGWIQNNSTFYSQFSKTIWLKLLKSYRITRKWKVENLQTAKNSKHKIIPLETEDLLLAYRK